MNHADTVHVVKLDFEKVFFDDFDGDALDTSK